MSLADFRRLVVALRQDEKGVTALEYGLIAAILGAAVITAFTTLGTGLGTFFTSVVAKLTL
ncbi:Flp family type IVb pilin [Roseomonas stagni]|uniref:Flp family type IVb pilin n=1 Tax=Falsiroseomonas algicola TaxID=2716930 RepID=A0A6M1LDL3_9PROT|nr:Flp family type IVb pilin [Falsiroseomonas algicola]NGM18378.1 Flp family type IVb pilin [Falsiroseomonas algicola]